MAMKTNNKAIPTTMTISVRKDHAPTEQFLEDAGEEVLIKKGPALRESINREYEALGKVAKSLHLSPQ
jgi:hypothetical protein